MFYKIRHKPTGLFFKPSTHPSKTNVSANGKVYQQRPTLKWLPRSLGWPVGKREKYRMQEWEYRRFVAEEWEIVEFGTDTEAL